MRARSRGGVACVAYPAACSVPDGRARGRRFQAQRAGVLRASRHQRDVRAGLLPRRPPGRPQHHHARRAHRLERRRAARAIARTVVADSEAGQARGRRGHAGNPRAAGVSRTRIAIARASIPSSIRISISSTRCARAPRANRSASASISTRPCRRTWSGKVGFNLELFPGPVVRQVVPARQERRRVPAPAQRPGRNADAGARQDAWKSRPRPSSIT